MAGACWTENFLHSKPVKHFAIDELRENVHKCALGESAQLSNFNPELNLNWTEQSKKGTKWTRLSSPMAFQLPVASPVLHCSDLTVQSSHFLTNDTYDVVILWHFTSQALQSWVNLGSVFARFSLYLTDMGQHWKVTLFHVNVTYLISGMGLTCCH